MKKKQLESTLEQTSAQIMNLEGQIASIETANINKETLDALSNASKAMKTIHGGLTIDKVDATMYVFCLPSVLLAPSSSRPSLFFRSFLFSAPCSFRHSLFFTRLPPFLPTYSLYHREDLEEQHAISKEIATALTQGSVANQVDDDELESELADLQQEELDNKMLHTGTVPVSDQVHRLPNVATGEGESRSTTHIFFLQY